MARDPRKPLLERVVGGFEAKQGSFPWTAAIRLKPDRHHCGAAIITHFHLLTAAHCFEYFPNSIFQIQIQIVKLNALRDEKDLTQYEIIVGDWDNLRPDGTEQIFEVESVTPYPKYES